PIRHNNQFRRPLNSAVLIGELRRVASDPSAPAVLRDAAVSRLARLALATGADGSTLFPNADPRHWWGVMDRTDNDSPVASPRLVPLSASSVATVDGCALRWFLERKAAAQEPAGEAQGIGLVFHALAAEVALNVTPPDLDALLGRLD